MRPRQVEVKSKGQPIKSEKQLLRSKDMTRPARLQGLWRLRTDAETGSLSSNRKQDRVWGGGVSVLYAA